MRFMGPSRSWASEEQLAGADSTATRVPKRPDTRRGRPPVTDEPACHASKPPALGSWKGHGHVADVGSELLWHVDCESSPKKHESPVTFEEVADHSSGMGPRLRGDVDCLRWSVETDAPSSGAPDFANIPLLPNRRHQLLPHA
jgi:hypothetical protein